MQVRKLWHALRSWMGEETVSSRRLLCHSIFYDHYTHSEIIFFDRSYPTPFSAICRVTIVLAKMSLPAIVSAFADIKWLIVTPWIGENINIEIGHCLILLMQYVFLIRCYPVGGDRLLRGR